ncbi:MAG: hypothetical protein PHH46_07505, partial [Firmicutes bacterium]|nr:hypothetical protein [Bacillota bacterium]
EYVGWILADHEEVEEQVVQGLNPHCSMRYGHEMKPAGNVRLVLAHPTVGHLALPATRPAQT